jgi:predicted small lipoprotein YifL
MAKKAINRATNRATNFSKPEISESLITLKPFAVLILGALLTAGSLAGCGQKGDLYMPEDDEKSAKKSSSSDLNP